MIINFLIIIQGTMKFKEMAYRIRKSYITYRIILIGIMCVGIFMRLYNLDGIPGGIHPDEAYAAYNAYSMANYGVDTFGYHNPVYFVAWGGGMNALNSYLMIPMIKMFGMNLWTIRMPQALLSCLSILVFYLLIRKIFNRGYALMAAFLLAINPWHIMMTRNNIESGLLPAFFIFGFYFFIKGLEDSRWLYVSAISYGLCLYSYAVIWPVLPFIILFQTVYCIFYKKINIHDKNLWFSAILLLILAMPLLLFLLINYGIIGEIKTAFISIPKLVAFRSSDISVHKISNNLMMMLRMFDTQQDDMPMNCDVKYGFYYRFSNVFIIIGLCVIMARAFKTFRSRQFCTSNMIAMHFAMIFILGMFIVNPHATRLNCIHAIFITFIVVGIYWISEHIWSQFRYAMVVLYMCAFYAFAMFYKKDYNTNVRELYQPGIGYCMEDVAEHEGKVYIDSRISYSVVLYYSRMPVKEFMDTVVYDDPYNPYMKALSYGRYITVHSDKEQVTKLSDYTGLGEGIYVLDATLRDELAVDGYYVTTYGDYCVAYR